MAFADYYAVADAIKTILEADATITGVGIGIEEDLEFREGNQITIYLDGRSVPEDAQVIAAGKKTRFDLEITLECRAFSINTRQESMELRDDLIGKVEVSLMSNRKLNNTVDMFILTGGRFDTDKGRDGGFISVGEVTLVARITATA